MEGSISLFAAWCLLGDICRRSPLRRAKAGQLVKQHRTAASAVSALARHHLQEQLDTHPRQAAAVFASRWQVIEA
jgi:hypothetical protein